MIPNYNKKLDEEFNYSNNELLDSLTDTREVFIIKNKCLEKILEKINVIKYDGLNSLDSYLNGKIIVQSDFWKKILLKSKLINQL